MPTIADRPAPPPTYESADPGRFHPSGSALARLIRHVTPDPLRAEALHLLGTAALLLACAGAYLASGSLPGAWSPGVASAAIWGGVGVVLLALTGRAPGVAVVLNADGLFVRRGDRAASLSLDEIAGCRPLGARTYHRVHRRYAGVRSFASRTSALLLVETASGPVVIGCASQAERHALHTALESRLSARCAPSPRVALAA
jgi:hypothetical protein